MGVQIYEKVTSFPLDISPEVALLDLTVVQFLIFEEPPNCFQGKIAPFILKLSILFEFLITHIYCHVKMMFFVWDIIGCFCF